ncbi:hypothetical protein SUDANB2_06805 [Streptomyces sp. enrichment culture]
MAVPCPAGNGANGPSGHTEFMSDAQEEHPKPNAVRVNESGVLEYFDGERWAPYLDLPDDDPGPLGVVFRGEDR